MIEKLIKNYSIIFTVLFLGLVVLIQSCSTISAPSDPSKPVEVESDPPPTRTNDILGEIRTLVAESSCSKYKWKNRSVAPRAYLNGVALMYAKQVCGQGTDFIKSEKIKSTYRLPWNKYSSKHDDALAHYGIDGSALNTYTFLIGLGMRESSGKYCEGRDLSQGFTKANSAEAGIYQMAYGAKLFNTELEPLYKKYKAGELDCELAEFSPGVKCKDHDSITYGSGEGAEWQILNKKCPAASVQWAAILIRSKLTHFGPIKRKEVEYKTACRDMLQKVELVAKANCEQV